MTKQIICFFITLIILLITGCEEIVTERSYVIMNDAEDVDVGPVFIPDSRDGAFDVSTSTIELSSPIFSFAEPTVINVGTTRSIEYHAHSAGDYYPSTYNFNIDGIVYTGKVIYVYFNDYPYCSCHHCNPAPGEHFELTYEIKDYVYIWPQPNQWIHDEGYIAPRVLKYGNGYIMWYTKIWRQYDSSPVGRKTGYKKFDYLYQTKCMFSTDGVTWDENGINPAYFNAFTSDPNSDDRGGIVISNVIQKSESFYVAYYIAKNIKSGENKGWKMYSSFSSNPEPIYWTRKNGIGLYLAVNTGSTEASFDKDSIGTGNVIYENNKYMMWFTGTSGTRSKIGLATSDEGISNWKKTSDPIYKGTRGKFDQQSVMDPYVIKDNGLYKMFYTGYNGKQYQVGLAYSYDGIEFGFYDKKNYLPIELGSPNDDIRYPCVLIDQVDNHKIYRIYYSKKDSTGKWKIHMAVSKTAME
jgi:predicted GH43/DUF377 family glycosyl hydrolase